MKKPEIKVGTGMRVELELMSHTADHERMTFIIVPDESADYSRGYLSESAPLAKALSGHIEGVTIPYEKGELYAVHLISVTKNLDTPLADLAEERQASYAKAVRDAELANAISFASSFTGKWGDYDPDSLPKDS